MSLRAAFWASFALMLAGAAAMLFWTGPGIEPQGLAPFDTRTAGYDHDEALPFLTALTPEARALYLGPQRIADTVFPVGFLGVLALGAFLALRRWSIALAMLATLPALGYFAFDMAENAAVARLLTTAPDAVSAEAVARASTFTIWKYHLIDLALAVLALAWLARGVARLRSRER